MVERGETGYRRNERMKIGISAFKDTVKKMCDTSSEAHNVKQRFLFLILTAIWTFRNIIKIQKTEIIVQANATNSNVNLK